MLSKVKLLALAAVATVALAAAAGTASATTVSPGGSITSASESVTFAGGSIEIICPLTLSGELGTEIPAVAGEVFGEISSVEVGECAGGSVTGILNLPFNLVYQELTETGMAFTVERPGFNLQVVIFGIPVNCLYEGDVPALVAIDGEGNTGAINITANGIPFAEGSGFCPAEGEMNGSFSLEPQQNIQL